MGLTPKAFSEALGLTRIGTALGEDVDSISVPDLNRPGLQFAGYFDVFSGERVQVIGLTEMAYLTALEPEIAEQRLRRFFSYPVPCVVIARALTPPEALLRQAGLSGVPVYGTAEATSSFSARATMHLAECFAPRETRHGVLMDVYGQGVLITGESGVGKSECALELLRHGHQLVADDVVEIRRVGSKLYGSAPELIRDFMELRGVGIVDIKKIYGIGAVEESRSIDLVISIALWRDDKSYDRLGNAEERIDILGISLPRLEIPVSPGRSLATIVEIAARRWHLIAEGYNATQELERRLRARYQEQWRSEAPEE